MSEESFQAEPGDLISWGEEVGSLRRPGGQFTGQDAGESGAALPSSRQLCACREKAVEKEEAILRAQSGTGMLCVLTARVERPPNRYHLVPVIN